MMRTIVRTERPHEDHLAPAIDAARAAGRIIRDGMTLPLEVRYKGEINLVTQIDVAAERAIVERLRAHGPDHSIVAEEGSGHEGPSPYRWFIDPLDGTTNYAHRFPFFCVSIGLQFETGVVLGVVYDPVRDELFTAVRGSGARCNDRPIAVSTTTELSGSLLVTGFAYDAQRTTHANFPHFANMSRVAQGIRRTGSAALDLCYVAAGRSDGFWELNLSPWDTAAGLVLVEEAGGRVTDFAGAPFSPYGTQVVASNGVIHAAMLSVLAHAPPPAS